MIIKDINPKKDLIFDLKVSEACKSCKRYGLTGCCPPNIGTFDYYKKLLKRYTYGKIFIEKFNVNDSKNWKEIGTKSSKILHKRLLEEKNKLLNNGHYFNTMFGGGSCRWCKECKIPCAFPQFRAIPIEATGIDVVTSLARLGIIIKFPIKKVFYRIGVLVWD